MEVLQGYHHLSLMFERILGIFKSCSCFKWHWNSWQYASLSPTADTQVTPNDPVWGSHAAPTAGSGATCPCTRGLLGSVTRVREAGAPQSPAHALVQLSQWARKYKTTPSVGLHYTPGGALGHPYGLALTTVKKSFVIISYLREGKYLFSELEVSCMTLDLW